MKFELRKKNHGDPGSKGLPEDYPRPPEDQDLLFYIQRNHDYDTIVYKINRNPDGLINSNLPMHAYWIKYSEGGKIVGLNHMQSKLAYGYESTRISKDLYSFRFVSYKDLTLFIARDPATDQFRVNVKLNHKHLWLNNIYVYAVEFGVFPDVKFIELYGEHFSSGFPMYHKITLAE